MASRSFKPSSYLSSRRRASFARTSSSSSLSSASSKSEDSFVAFRPSTVAATKLQESGCVARSGFIPGTGTGTNSHPASISSSPHVQPRDQPDDSDLDTPTGRGSRPITIELPSSAIAARKKSLPVCTPDEPLSARGDLPGGYFPLHEDPSTRSYKPHPFHYSSSSQPPTTNSTTQPTTMPSSSRDSTPRAPIFPEATLVMPMGKYHPSNYKIAPTSAPSSTPVNTNLSMPPSSTRQSHSSANKHHKRNGSDVKRKIQQYQRDMIAQARLASMSSAPSGSGMGPTGLVTKPISPRLLPLGSPDELSAVMTPLELGDGLSGDGYLGARTLGGRAEGRESEMVGRMIRMEEERRRREGQSSPAARV